jgi:hypothetical protein
MNSCEFCILLVPKLRFGNAIASEALLHSEAWLHKQIHSQIQFGNEMIFELTQICFSFKT